MLDICQNDITLTRGDNADINVEVILCNEKTHEKYEIKDTDRIFFRVKRKARSDFYYINKEAELVEDEEGKNYAVIHLDPEDTLSIPFGRNRFEVELVTEDNDHYTIVADHTFTVGKELEIHGEA